jgi:hypothetical protein
VECVKIVGGSVVCGSWYMFISSSSRNAFQSSTPLRCLDRFSHLPLPRSMRTSYYEGVFAGKSQGIHKGSAEFRR